MEEMPTEILVSVIGIIVAAVTGIITYFTARAQSRSEVQKAEVSTRGEEWEKLLEQVKTHYDDQLGELRERLTRLEKELHEKGTRYRDSITHIREWRTAHPETAEKLTPPESIKDDL